MPLSSFLFPELTGGDGRAIRHGLELCEDNIGVDRRLSDPGAVTAIATSDHVFAPDKSGVTPDALRNLFRVLDEIRF
jgi:hypothetical protein